MKRLRLLSSSSSVERKLTSEESPRKTSITDFPGAGGSGLCARREAAFVITRPADGPLHSHASEGNIYSQGNIYSPPATRRQDGGLIMRHGAVPAAGVRRN